MDTLRYTGAYFDPVTGTYPLGAGYRFYLTHLMRFCEPDGFSPFGPGGTNPYCYCADDPINRRDPSGHISVSKLFSGFRSIIRRATKDADEPIAALEARGRSVSDVTGQHGAGAAEARPFTHTRAGLRRTARIWTELGSSGEQVEGAPTSARFLAEHPPVPARLHLDDAQVFDDEAGPSSATPRTAPATAAERRETLVSVYSHSSVESGAELEVPTEEKQQAFGASARPPDAYSSEQLKELIPRWLGRNGLLQGWEKKFGTDQEAAWEAQNRWIGAVETMVLNRKYEYEPFPWDL